MEQIDNKRLVVIMAAMACLQTFFVMVMGAMIVFKSAEWVILGCLLLFSLVNLGVTFLIGTIVIRIVESIRKQSIDIRQIDETIKKMLRGPRPDGLIDIDESPTAASPEAVHKNMMRRFGA